MSLLNTLFMGLDRLRARWQPDGFCLRQLLRREKYRCDYDIVADSLLRRLSFQTVLDVGCANGFLLQRFLNASKDVAGLDRAEDVLQVLPPLLRPRVQVVDFALAQGRFDLVCCVEVAEHLPPNRSVELVEKLIGLARRWIYFSAAPPGQLGLGHVNSRPRSDWLNWFGERQWSVDEPLTRAFRADLSLLRKAGWLKRNSFILAPAIKAITKPRLPSKSPRPVGVLEIRG